MCRYANVTYRCGHSELLAGPNCELLLHELSRIDHEPSAWTPEGLRTLPFHLPEICSPSSENTVDIVSGNFCGWECRNSHPRPVHAAGTTVDMGRGALPQQTNDGNSHGSGSSYVRDAGRTQWGFDHGSFDHGSFDAQRAGAQTSANTTFDPVPQSFRPGPDRATATAQGLVGGIADAHYTGTMELFHEHNVSGMSNLLEQTRAVRLDSSAEAGGAVGTRIPDTGHANPAERQGRRGRAGAGYGRPRLGAGLGEGNGAGDIVQSRDWTEDGEVFE
ncbi:hypothetical protein F5Y05DRAFT_407054 [Hypoxylon sp. FL0543]|nr:hypothetical protein F5Y05DRAFT_407054 [Hypoxylon sp. FL0543]